jgi:hypothetical protein
MKIFLLRILLLLFSCGLTELGAIAASRSASNQLAAVEYVVLSRMEKS